MALMDENCLRAVKMLPRNTKFFVTESLGT